MSVGREVESRQWACFACCTLGCGFDDPQNTCPFVFLPLNIRLAHHPERILRPHSLY